jgi:uncharacterized protein (TIGR02996 family)
MATEDDFIQAIQADPDADAARLAYADWLHDHGDPDRAAFIRLQCAMWHIERSERDAVRAQWQSLLERNRDRCLGPLRKLLEDPPPKRSWLRRWLARQPPPQPWYDRHLVLIRRGFVEHVVIPAAKFISHAEQLFVAAPLLTDLTLYPIEHAEFEPCFRVPLLQQLRAIRILANDAGMAAIRCLLNSPYLGNVHSLTLGSFLLDAECIRSLVESPLMCQLTCLELSFAGDEEVRVLASSPNCRGLTELSVLGVALSDKGVACIVGSPYLQNLRVLRVVGERLGDAEAIAVAQADLGRLELLHFEGQFVTRVGKEALRKRFGKRVYLGLHD